MTPASVRQWLYPEEFRIPAVPWPSGVTTLLEQCLVAITAERDAPAKAPASEPSMKFLAEVSTGLWRLRQRMLQPGTNRPLEEMRRAYRHLESTWDALAQAGVSILDHTDMPFDTGLALKVITFEPRPDLTRERIVETLKPTVYYKDARLQMGEVIVGTPPTPGATS